MSRSSRRYKRFWLGFERDLAPPVCQTICSVWSARQPCFVADRWVIGVNNRHHVSSGSVSEVGILLSHRQHKPLFADMTALAIWYDHDDVQQVIAEVHSLATGVTTELCGPSPIVPQPVWPGG